MKLIRHQELTRAVSTYVIQNNVTYNSTSMHLIGVNIQVGDPLSVVDASHAIPPRPTSHLIPPGSCPSCTPTTMPVLSLGCCLPLSLLLFVQNMKLTGSPISPMVLQSIALDRCMLILGVGLSGRAITRHWSVDDIGGRHWDNSVGNVVGLCHGISRSLRLDELSVYKTVNEKFISPYSPQKFGSKQQEPAEEWVSKNCQRAPCWLCDPLV
jgi:hypothetical protein